MRKREGDRWRKEEWRSGEYSRRQDVGYKSEQNSEQEDSKKENTVCKMEENWKEMSEL